MPNSLCPTDYTYLSFLPCHLNGVIALSSTEYITQIRNPSTLVTMTNLSKHIAFEMCYASLKRHPKEFPHPTTTSSPLIPSATMNPIFWTPLSFKCQRYHSASCALCRNVEYPQYIAPTFLCNVQCNIGRFTG